MPELKGYRVSSRSTKMRKRRKIQFSEQEQCMKNQMEGVIVTKKLPKRRKSKFGLFCCLHLSWNSILGADKQETSELKQRVQIFNTKTVILSLHTRVPGFLFQF
jgi:hypothetical protein